MSKQPTNQPSAARVAQPASTCLQPQAPNQPPQQLTLCTSWRPAVPRRCAGGLGHGLQAVHRPGACDQAPEPDGRAAAGGRGRAAGWAAWRGRGRVSRGEASADVGRVGCMGWGSMDARVRGVTSADVGRVGCMGWGSMDAHVCHVSHEGFSQDSLLQASLLQAFLCPLARRRSGELLAQLTTSLRLNFGLLAEGVQASAAAGRRAGARQRAGTGAGLPQQAYTRKHRAVESRMSVVLMCGLQGMVRRMQVLQQANAELEAKVSGGPICLEAMEGERISGACWQACLQDCYCCWEGAPACRGKSDKRMTTRARATKRFAALVSSGLDHQPRGLVGRGVRAARHSGKAGASPLPLVSLTSDPHLVLQYALYFCGSHGGQLVGDGSQEPPARAGWQPLEGRSYGRTPSQLVPPSPASNQVKPPHRGERTFRFPANATAQRPALPAAHTCMHGTPRVPRSPTPGSHRGQPRAALHLPAVPGRIQGARDAHPLRPYLLPNLPGQQQRPVLRVRHRATRRGELATCKQKHIADTKAACT
jgi:hypothetical protein